MQKLKQILCLMLAVGLVLSLGGISVFAAEDVKLSKSSVTMLVGGSTVLKVTGTNSSVTWSSSDKSVCTVSKSGKVTAKAEGTAKISAKVGNKTLSCKVTVVKSYINSVSSQSLDKGESITLYVKAYNVKKAKAVSSNSGIVKVSSPTISDGRIVVKVSGVAAGTAKIKLYDASNKNAYALFKVTVNSKGSSGSSVKASSDSNYAEEIVKLINNIRVKEGYDKVILDDTLCKAAQIRVKEFADGYTFIRPDGSGFYSVFEEVGLPFAACAELNAQGYDNSADAFDYWNDSYHNSLLGYSYIGVGYDEKSETWIIIFRG